jgi:hypothetical protein
MLPVLEGLRQQYQNWTRAEAWAHSQVLWVWAPSYSHRIWVENGDVIGQDDLRYRAATPNRCDFIVAFPPVHMLYPWQLNGNHVLVEGEAMFMAHDVRLSP